MEGSDPGVLGPEGVGLVVGEGELFLAGGVLGGGEAEVAEGAVDLVVADTELFGQVGEVDDPGALVAVGEDVAHAAVAAGDVVPVGLDDAGDGAVGHPPTSGGHDAAYLAASDDTRRLFNQAFFAKIYIDEDDETRERAVRVDYNEPFDNLLSRLVPARVHHDLAQEDAHGADPVGGSSGCTSRVAEGQRSHTSTLVVLRCRYSNSDQLRDQLGQLLTELDQR